MKIDLTPEAAKGKTNRMNIQTKITELNQQIEDRSKTEEILRNESSEKYRIYTETSSVWADVWNHVHALKVKRDALIAIQKDCECVISRGVPVPDEDIGRTVEIRENPIDQLQDLLAMTGVQLQRVPLFKGEQEKEHLS